MKYISILFVLFISSCISINPKMTSVNTKEKASNILLDNKTALPFEANSVVANKASRKNIRFIELTINNSTTEPIIINEKAFDVFADMEPVKWQSNWRTYKKLNNSYLLPAAMYVAGIAVSRKKTVFYDEAGFDTGNQVEFITNTPAIIAYSLSAASLGTVLYGNFKLYKELKAKSIYGKTVLPSKTISGYIAVKAKPEAEILMRIK